jgi:hypothetical protein
MFAARNSFPRSLSIILIAGWNNAEVEKLRRWEDE